MRAVRVIVGVGRCLSVWGVVVRACVRVRTTMCVLTHFPLACRYQRGSGYTQGMNFVAGNLLRHTSAPLAFALLSYLLDTAKVNGQSVYSPDLPLVDDLTAELKGLVATHLPAMSAHLENISFDYNLFMKWYMGMFASGLRAGGALDDVWDVVFSFGWKTTLYACARALTTLHTHTGWTSRPLLFFFSASIVG